MTEPTLPRNSEAGLPQAAPIRPIDANGRPIPMRVTRPQPQPRRRGSSWMAMAGYAGLGVACILAGAVTFLLIAAPVDLIRDRAVELVKARTGRDLIVAGPTKLTYFPSFGVAFSQVSLAAPAEMGGSPLLAARRLQVELPVWSLLSQRISARRVRVEAPVIELRVDAQGRRSWDFAMWQERPTRLAQAGGRSNDAAQDVPRPGGGRSRAGLLPAANVHVVDATVRYVDERSGTSREVSGLELDLVADDAGSGIVAKGGLIWTGEKVGFEAKLAALEGRNPAKVSLRVAGRPLEVAFDGSVALGSSLEADGTLQAQAASWAELVRWLSNQRVAAHDMGALAVSMRVAAADQRIALSELSATLGERSLSGAVTVTTAGQRPRVTGQLQLTELDFRRLLVRPRSRASAGGASADPIGEVLQGKGAEPAGKSPQADASTAKAAKGWSDDVIDLTPLGLADADLALAVDRLVYKNVTTGPSRLNLALQDRVATVALEDVQLYSGRARGTLTLDGRSQTAVTTTNLTLDGVSALPLLNDALDFGWLDGRGRITVALTGQGSSERQMVETLRGKVDLAVSDGAIIGLDIGRLLANLEKARLSELRTNPNDKTPFSEFSGSFAIADGIAHNQDLKLASPHLHVSGSGQANLAQRTVDYTVRPKIAASQTGDGSVVGLAGLEVPIRVEGPWDKPTFTPDVKSVLGSEQAGAAIKQIGKNLKSQEVQDAIRGLLGGGDGQQKVKPRDLLEKLLKKDPQAP
ncbi:MAG TPA: AsmA family protein [Hyphomicrobiaceae bacterium]|nr:AsmA family protein [Hyphomicrobiaceae bacterium]